MEREDLSCIWLVESAGKGSLSPTAVSGNLSLALQSPYLPQSPLCLVRDLHWGQCNTTRAAGGSPWAEGAGGQEYREMMDRLPVLIQEDMQASDSTGAIAGNLH